jgi:hypothetical protein
METPTRWTRLPEHVVDSATQVVQDHVATRVLLVIGTNNHLDILENTAEQATRAPLECTGQSGPSWSNLAKPENFHRRLLHRLGRCSSLVRPFQAKKFQSTEQTYRAPKQTKLETTATRDNRELTKTFTRVKLNQGSASVRLVRGFS